MKKCIQSGSFPGPAHCCLTCPIRLISPAQNVRTKEFRTFFFYDNNTQHQIHFAISARLQINTSFPHRSSHSKRQPTLFSLEIKRRLDQRALHYKKKQQLWGRARDFECLPRMESKNIDNKEGAVLHKHRLNCGTRQIVNEVIFLSSLAFISSISQDALRVSYL